MGRTDVEPAISAARQPRDFAKGPLRHCITTLLKHERRDPEQAQLARRGAEIVDWLLHGVADEDQRLHFFGFVFTFGVRQDFSDLGVAASAVDLLHQPAELARIGNPARSAAFGQPAIIEELNVQPADRGGLIKHVALQTAGGIPHRLAAHGGVERKDQPAALAGRRGRAERFHLVEKGIDLRARRRRGRLFAGVG